MGLDALAKWILDRLLALWPFYFVDQWKLGMLVRRGRIVRAVRSGSLGWRWPFLERIETWASTTIPLDLATGSPTTNDGYAISISGNLRYRVEDIVKAWGKYWHIEAAVKQLALGLICSYAAGEKWRSLRANRKGLEETLLVELNDFFNPDGIKIEGLNLTDLIRVDGKRMYFDGQASQLTQSVASMEEE